MTRQPRSWPVGAAPQADMHEAGAASAVGGFSEERRAAGPTNDGGLGAALSAVGSRGKGAPSVSQRSL